MTANNTTIQIKRGNLANLTVLAPGELAFTTDTHNLYVGDGVRNYLFESVFEETMIQDTNILINSGFDICQRSLTPATSFTIADNRYSADRWRVNRATADLQYQRLSAISYTDICSMYYGRYTKITAAGKFAVYQPVESVISASLINKTVQFQISMRVSTACTMNIGILSLQSPAVADTIPNPFITAFNSDGVLPSFSTNLSLISYSSFNVTASTSWITVYLTAIIPANTVNVIPIVWTNSAAPINFYLDLAEAILLNPSETSYSILKHNKFSPQLEYLLCLRYFEAQYNNSSDGYRPFASGMCINGTILQGILNYYPKRIIPSITRSADSTLCWWRNTGAVVALTSATATSLLYINNSNCIQKDTFAAGSFTAGNSSLLTANALATAWYYFDSEL